MNAQLTTLLAALTALCHTAVFVSGQQSERGAGRFRGTSQSGNAARTESIGSQEWTAFQGDRGRGADLVHTASSSEDSQPEQGSESRGNRGRDSAEDSRGDREAQDLAQHSISSNGTELDRYLGLDNDNRANRGNRSTGRDSTFVRGDPSREDVVQEQRQVNGASLGFGRGRGQDRSTEMRFENHSLNGGRQDHVNIEPNPSSASRNHSSEQDGQWRLRDINHTRGNRSDRSIGGDSMFDLGEHSRETVPQEQRQVNGASRVRGDGRGQNISTEIRFANRSRHTEMYADRRRQDREPNLSNASTIQSGEQAEQWRLRDDNENRGNRGNRSTSRDSMFVRGELSRENVPQEQRQVNSTSRGRGDGRGQNRSTETRFENRSRYTAMDADRVRQDHFERYPNFSNASRNQSSEQDGEWRLRQNPSEASTRNTLATPSEASDVYRRGWLSHASHDNTSSRNSAAFRSNETNLQRTHSERGSGLEPLDNISDETVVSERFVLSMLDPYTFSSNQTRNLSSTSTNQSGEQNRRWRLRESSSSEAPDTYRGGWLSNTSEVSGLEMVENVSDETVVSGSLVLSVLAPYEFTYNPTARAAVQGVVADMANVTTDQIDVFMRVERRLSSTNTTRNMSLRGQTERNQSDDIGSVIANYQILLLSAARASNVRGRISRKSLSELSGFCQRRVIANRLNVTVRVVAAIVDRNNSGIMGNNTENRDRLNSSSDGIRLRSTGNLRGGSSAEFHDNGVWAFVFAVCACAMGLLLLCVGARLYVRVKKLETKVVVIGETHATPVPYKGTEGGLEKVVTGAISNGSEKVVSGRPLTPTYAWIA